MDRHHNPEFTALEFYQAYADYHDTLAFTEDLFRSLATDLGSTSLRFRGQEINLGPPFARLSLFELLKTHTGEDLSGVTEAQDLLQFARERQLDVPDGLNYGQLLDKIFGQLVEPQLIQPTFVVDYPKAISPLAKTHREGPDSIVERFELFIEGMEIANAYTELNDPDLQEQLFRTQLGGLKEKDSMAKMDHDFIRALRHGMPPAGGLGLGVDRLVMLLTGSQNIREVILFPLLRPEEHKG